MPVNLSNNTQQQMESLEWNVKLKKKSNTEQRGQKLIVMDTNPDSQ